MGIGSPNPLLLATAAGSGGDSDPVTRSLRLDGGESLSRTFSSTGDSKKFTFACWVKRTKLGGNQRIFQASNANNDDFLRFNNNNTLGYWIYQNGSHNHQGNTTAVFRDVSAWLHVCYVVDTAQATAANRVKIFVNGVSHALSVYPDQNRDCSVMNTAALHYIGRYGNSASEYANLYIADAYFLDGSAVNPVGNFIEDNGYGGYKPKDAFDMSSYSGNSFHLKFEDSSDIGADSANSNDFTATNLASHDVVLDVPHPKNYAVINPLIPYGTAANSGGVTLSEGNLRVDTGSGSGWGSQDATIAAPSGKFYFEAYVRTSSHSTGGQVGVHPVDGWVYAGNSSRYLGYTNTSAAYQSSGDLYTNGSSTSTGYASYTTGDVVGCAFDVDSRKVWFSKNGTWQNSGNPANGSNPAVTLSGSGPLIPAVRAYLHNWIVNFGQDPYFAGSKSSGQDTSQNEFYYAPPSGFKSLNTSNFDDPTIKPHEVFGVATYSGTGSATTVSTDFQPNLVWVKRRNSSANHVLTDSVRGANKALNSNTTSTEDSSTSLITAFNSASFGVGTDSKVNASGGTYMGWHWKESANAGFDIVTYEGNSDTSGDTQSISHSLGVAPEMIIVKARDGRAANDYYARDMWYVWHKYLTSGSSLYLNDTSAAVDYSSGYTSAPISSVGSSTFTVCNAEEYNNYYYDYLNWGDPYGYYTGSNERYVAYLFSSVAGVSSFGKYTGNGSSSNGPFVYTGHRPRFLMIKRIGGNAPWKIFDSERDPHNVATKNLYADSSQSEGDLSSHSIDLLSNGFKWRTSGSHENASGNDFIFISFAESPLKYANAR